MSKKTNEGYSTQIHKILGDFNIKNHIVDRSIVLNSKNNNTVDSKIQVAKGINTLSNIETQNGSRQEIYSENSSYRDSKDQDSVISKIDYENKDKNSRKTSSDNRDSSVDWNPLNYASDLGKKTKAKLRQGLDYVENLKNALKKKINNNSDVSTKNIQEGNSNPLKCTCECEIDSETCENAMFWANSLDIKNVNLLTKTYRDILSKAEREKDYTKQIKNDLHRTLPEVDYFKAGQEGSVKLENVLIATSCYDPGVGYVQGMNFIGASILYHAEEV